MSVQHRDEFLEFATHQSQQGAEEMVQIKRRYTFKEAAEYLKRETGTPELSAHDLATLAAEGKLAVCFPYKGQLGLFENGNQTTSDHAEVAKAIFGTSQKTVYFNGILRSLSRPAPDNMTADLQGRMRKVQTLNPVRVVPVCDFGSAQSIEMEEPEGYHWRRVHSSRHPWAGTGITSGVPDAEWLIEAESLYALVTQFQPSGATGSASNPIQEETPQQRQDRRLEYLH